jgi:TPR repeat protein
MRRALATAIYFASLVFATRGFAENPVDKFSCDSVPQLKKDADKNDPNAEWGLALLTLNERCGLTDTTEGGRWLGKASFQGYTPAMGLSAAVFYSQKRYAESAKWAKLAADKGDANAQILLATMLYLGQGGVTQDYTEAAKWAKRSAEQGNGPGEQTFAAFYSKGIGVPKDNIEADKWLILSLKTESRELGIKARAMLEPEMSKQDIAEAQRRADAWKAKPEFQEE